MTELAMELHPIFEHALALGSPVLRARYLADACGDDDELRAEIDSLLWAREIEGHPIEIPPDPDDVGR